jgi:hypothetical protein
LGALHNPGKAQVSMDYQHFLLMDILHLKEEEIRGMDLLKYLNALTYSFTTYMRRDMVLLFSSMFGKKNMDDDKMALEIINKHKPSLLKYEKDCGEIQKKEREAWFKKAEVITVGTM